MNLQSKTIYSNANRALIPVDRFETSIVDFRRKTRILIDRYTRPDIDLGEIEFNHTIDRISGEYSVVPQFSREGIQLKVTNNSCSKRTFF